MVCEQRSNLTAGTDASRDSSAVFALIADLVAAMMAPRSDDCRAGRAEWTRMPLPRIAWLVTVAVALLTGVIVLFNGYTGYGVLSFVVAVSAAINLR
jgi:hypothetical protein